MEKIEFTRFTFLAFVSDKFTKSIISIVHFSEFEFLLKLHFWNDGPGQNWSGDFRGEQDIKIY